MPMLGRHRMAKLIKILPLLLVTIPSRNVPVRNVGTIVSLRHRYCGRRPRQQPGTGGRLRYVAVSSGYLGRYADAELVS